MFLFTCLSVLSGIPPSGLLLCIPIFSSSSCCEIRLVCPWCVCAVSLSVTSSGCVRVACSVCTCTLVTAYIVFHHRCTACYLRVPDFLLPVLCFVLAYLTACHSCALRLCSPAPACVCVCVDLILPLPLSLSLSNREREKKKKKRVRSLLVSNEALLFVLLRLF